MFWLDLVGWIDRVGFGFTSFAFAWSVSQVAPLAEARPAGAELHERPRAPGHAEWLWRMGWRCFGVFFWVTLAFFFGF